MAASRATRVGKRGVLGWMIYSRHFLHMFRPNVLIGIFLGTFSVLTAENVSEQTCRIALRDGYKETKSPISSGRCVRQPEKHESSLAGNTIISNGGAPKVSRNSFARGAQACMEPFIPLSVLTKRLFCATTAPHHSALLDSYRVGTRHVVPVPGVREDYNIRVRVRVRVRGGDAGAQ